MDTEQLMQKYFNNTINQKEQLVFDDLLLNDENFKKEFQEFNDMHSVIKKETKNLLKQELKNLDKINKTSYFYKIMIAASFAMLLSVGSYFMFTDNSLSNDELFASNFSPCKNVMHPVVRGKENLSQIEKSFVYYENGNYSKFIEIIATSNYKSLDYNFYIANAYLANNNPKEAKLILEDYLDSKAIKFPAKAHWYLGLVYLKLNDLSKAKKQFIMVKKTGSFKPRDVDKILKQLEF